jgi:hypothetical protein
MKALRSRFSFGLIPGTSAYLDLRSKGDIRESPTTAIGVEIIILLRGLALVLDPIEEYIVRGAARELP